MRDIVLGPTFDLTLGSTSDEAERAVAEWIREGRCPFHAARAGGHFTLSTPRATRHFWSPTLSIEVREHNGLAIVSGRFNPGPAIWTGYMLTYLSLITISLGALMWGIAELVLGRGPRAMALIPVCITIAAVLFWFSSIGQRLARPEMMAMHAAVCGVLEVDNPGLPCRER
ncbi:MAG: hypothetical protein K8E66_04875 [Phycisphaerales bacterium]|nr:hypothetical protein [Phycisphaerales bacterium]